MADARRRASACGVLTFTAFLTPSLLSPGPLALANVAGVAVAIWAGAMARRVSLHGDAKDALPYRIAPVGPGFVGASAVLLLLLIADAWTAADAPVRVTLDALMRRIWAFRFSPAAMFAAPAEGLPTPVDDAVRSTALALTAALILGAAVSLLALFGPISRRRTLRRHALNWKGGDVRVTRGVKAPIVGRLLLRAASLLVAFVTLAYAPVVFRVVAGSRLPPIRAFMEAPLMDLPFFAVWITGLWAIGVMTALIFAAAYLRLALTLGRA